MTSVAEAGKIILAETRSYGVEEVALHNAQGRILAQHILADRDMPPYNRVAMDGIAIRFSAFINGTRLFTIKGIQAAGETPIEITADNECIEIMTGAALPDSTDTIIRYEDLQIENGIATILIDDIRQGQNIHRKGIDKKLGDIVAHAGQIIDPAIISIAASVGNTTLEVTALPKVVIITTGNELVDITDTPTPYQIRKSNNHAINAVLNKHCINADIQHIPDDAAITKEKLQHCINTYDIIILSGGISAGKFDYVPQVLQELAVNKLFHKVEQRPGKPFWFGKHGNGCLVFAFPGNPVSTFMCLHRYLVPWLEQCLGLPKPNEVFAVLDKEVTFKPKLHYFVQVKIGFHSTGQITATPLEGNGSGDYANLASTDAFMELPAEKDNFNKGEAYRIWPFKKLM